MTEENIARAMQLLGALGIGGVGTAFIGKWITGGDAKLADGAAVRGELWQEVRDLRDDVEELREKYQKEHDDRVRHESFTMAFVSAYSDVRNKGLRMAELMDEDNPAWRIWADELKRTPDADSLFDQVVRGGQKRAGES